MVSDSYNIDNYGIGALIVASAPSTVSVTSGSNSITIAAGADGAAVSLDDFLCIFYGGSYDYWLVSRVTGKSGVGPYTVTINHSPTIATNSYSWGYVAAPRTLGNLKKYKTTFTSTMDKIGMPMGRSADAYMLDVQGVIRRIEIEGAWKDTPINGGSNARNIDYVLITGNQFGNPAVMFWHEAEYGWGCMIGFPVAIEEGSHELIESSKAAQWYPYRYVMYERKYSAW
jgi:hypothetical protein